MRIKNDNPWQSQLCHEGLVDIGTHCLWASSSGPIRGQKDPLIIFITGAGGPCAVYTKLQQQLSRFARVLFYDRAGYDRSTLPPCNPGMEEKIYAKDTARDLTKLLGATQLEPPYVLMSHSYGGIIARSFLEIHKDNPEVVVGMMLLDSATELMLQLFQRLPPIELLSVAQNVDWDQLTDIRRQSGMTDEEWEYAIKAQGRCVEALRMEDTHASARQLALKYQFDKQTFGARPLRVLRFNMTMDYQMLYEAGVKNGDGTQEERRKAMEFIQTFGLFHDQIARAQCMLSRDAEFQYYGDCGHDLPIRRSGVIVEELRMLLRRLNCR